MHVSGANEIVTSAVCRVPTYIQRDHQTAPCESLAHVQFANYFPVREIIHTRTHVSEEAGAELEVPVFQTRLRVCLKCTAEKL